MPRPALELPTPTRPPPPSDHPHRLAPLQPDQDTAVGSRPTLYRARTLGRAVSWRSSDRAHDLRYGRTSALPGDDPHVQRTGVTGPRRQRAADRGPRPAARGSRTTPADPRPATADLA